MKKYNEDKRQLRKLEVGVSLIVMTLTSGSIPGGGGGGTSVCGHTGT